MQKSLIGLILLAALSVTSCKGKDQPGVPLSADERTVRSDAFMAELNKEFSNEYSFQFIKYGQDDGNFAVIRYTDKNGVSRVMAADLAQYTPGTDYWSYASSRRFYFRLTDQGDGTYKCKMSTCIGYDKQPRSSSLVFEATQANPRDLEKAAAFIEDMKVNEMSANLSAEFGLSEERSLRVAKLATQWDRLSKSRAMTASDADVVAKEIIGTSLHEMDEAYMDMIQGNGAHYDALMTQAAQLNDVSPEQFNQITARLFQ